MKVHIEIECPPEEIRRLVGLPDLSAVQQELLEKMHQKIMLALDQTNPESLLKSWMGGLAENWQEWQKRFADFSTSFTKKDGRK